MSQVKENLLEIKKFIWSNLIDYIFQFIRCYNEEGFAKYRNSYLYLTYHEKITRCGITYNLDKKEYEIMFYFIKEFRLPKNKLEELFKQEFKSIIKNIRYYKNVNYYENLFTFTFEKDKIEIFKVLYKLKGAKYGN